MNPLHEFICEGFVIKNTWFHYGWLVLRIAVENILFYSGKVSLYSVHPTSTYTWGIKLSIDGTFIAYLMSIFTLQLKLSYSS